jgi:hypothetical protein
MTAYIAVRRSAPARGRGVLEMMICLTRSHGVKGAPGAARSPRVLAAGAAPRESADARPGGASAPPAELVALALLHRPDRARVRACAAATTRAV